MTDPWEVRWHWTTGYSGVDYFPNPERAIVFCDEILKRIHPPEYDVRLRVRNTETGQTLDSVIRDMPPVPKEVPEMATCGTCGGSGEIPIIQTGKTKKCTRCNGTGQE